ncbi:PH domain-containing protein [Couchioplanes caeruleus]|uniref:Low molecular weight protein antigen 6 PH domain-containing protein n=2 Tax=Couchioplanes caeruleus TaxID=56438 RepID=A0A1K0GKF0_9ACTN|nr:PH domain-containing protein [Couchioplanes caeruleus]OJF12758.1 hypothetical protein BG844_18925 [Couchioplanes caeruleus subsp. caeruleus]ROP31226.1 PH (Pleckstrin Homology) domain-containing protein [Couchioplanes caeruleus]
MAPHQWRVKPALPAVKLLGAAALIALVAAFGRRDPVQWVLVVVAGLGLAAWGFRDLIHPVRLAADITGVTVAVGFAGRRHLPWSRIERIRVDRRARRGIRSELLEIDAGESLHLFGAPELGAAPEDVARALQQLSEQSQGAVDRDHQ